MMATGGEYQMVPHLRVLTDTMLDIAAGDTKRVIVAMPPGHGKSTMTSQYFPAWMLGRFPKKKIMVCSYDFGLASSWGRTCRETLLQHGPSVFGMSVNPNTQRGDWWETTAGGRFYATSVGGGITGKRLDGIIIDDPFKSNEDANSEGQRQKKWDWFRSVAYTRLDPGGFVIIVMTRWHEEDIAGMIEKEMQKGTGDEYRVINLPALAIEGEEDELGRDPGEALWPERFSTEILEKTKSVVGTYWWQAMYQGNPQTPGGEVFKREWFNYWQPGEDEHHAKIAYGVNQEIELDTRSGLRYMTVDLAASLKDEANYTVICVWAKLASRRSPVYVLLDLVRARMDGPTILDVLDKTYKKWDCRIVGIESTGFQLALCQMAKARGMPVREIKPDKDKLSRALAATPAFERGEVWFPSNAPWLGVLEHELLGFPHGAKDDQVDAIAMGVAFGPMPSVIPRTPKKGTPLQRKSGNILDAKAPSDFGSSMFDDEE